MSSCTTIAAMALCTVVPHSTKCSWVGDILWSTRKSVCAVVSMFNYLLVHNGAAASEL